jgi:23S rRNA (guanosine2251-2'-O)-methyltransferase
MLFGLNPVREALRKGRPVSKVWLSRDEKDRAAREIVATCRDAKIPYIPVEKAYLDRLCPGAVHQGFAAQVAPKEFTPWQDMLALAAKAGEAAVIVVLDEVEDTYNLGAVLRSVEALGAHGAVIPKRRSAPLNSGAAKASAGAWEYVPLDRVTNIARTLEEMKGAGLWVVGADHQAGQSIYDTELTGPIALVLGGEDKGLSPLVRKSCDILAGIPMSGKINSLNVSAATAIILSEISRQRKK